MFEDPVSCCISPRSTLYGNIKTSQYQLPPTKILIILQNNTPPTGLSLSGIWISSKNKLIRCTEKPLIKLCPKQRLLQRNNQHSCFQNRINLSVTTSETTPHPSPERSNYCSLISFRVFLDFFSFFLVCSKLHVSSIITSIERVCQQRDKHEFLRC